METASLQESFSLEPDLLLEILTHAKPLGHGEQAGNLNLGFGFVYYGPVRALRPWHIVVIGSGYGFSVVCLALGLKDNGAGVLSFVDPSYSLLRTIGGTNFWDDPDHVQAHFVRFGVGEIVTHYKCTSEEFFDSYDGLARGPIDFAFIDGNHSFRHVDQDIIGTLRHSRKNSYLLLHDTNIYVRELLRHAEVKRWLRRKAAAKKAAFEYVDFPHAGAHANAILAACGGDVAGRRMIRLRIHAQAKPSDEELYSVVEDPGREKSRLDVGIRNHSERPRAWQPLFGGAPASVGSETSGGEARPFQAEQVRQTPQHDAEILAEPPARRHLGLRRRVARNLREVYEVGRHDAQACELLLECLAPTPDAVIHTSEHGFRQQEVFRDRYRVFQHPVHENHVQTRQLRRALHPLDRDVTEVRDELDP